MRIMVLDKKISLKKSGLVAIIRLEGVISTGGRFGGGINDQSLAPIIEKAFELGDLELLHLLSILRVVHHLSHHLSLQEL